MNENDSTDDVRALRGFDPAAGLEASAELHARVGAIPLRESAGPRRSRRWLAPVAAAAAFVIAAGGGYLWGTGGFSLAPPEVVLAVETGSPENPAPAMSLGGGGGGGGATAQSSEVIPGMAFAHGTFGDQVRGAHRFIIPALDTTPSQTSVFALDSQAHVSVDDTIQMAAALGVEGEIHDADQGGWMIGDYEGTYFALTPWGGASYSGGIPHAVTVCEEEATALHGRDKLNDDGTWAFGQEMIRCMAETPRPSDEFVQESVSRFLAAIGIDEDLTEITVMSDENDPAVYVIVALVVDGNVTDITANLTITSMGIMNAYGPVSDVVNLGRYAIVSPADAAKRLSDTAYASSLISAGNVPAEPVSIYPPPTPAPAPTPGAVVPWLVSDHEIVAVRLGLASIYGPAGEHFLAPAYEFTASDDTVWGVLALADESLDFVATP